MPESSHALCIGLCPLLAAAILAADLRVPLGVALGVPYVPVILLVGRMGMPWSPRAFALLATLFVVVGWSASPVVASSDPAFVTANRLLAVFVVWVVAITTTRPLSRREATTSNC